MTENVLPNPVLVPRTDGPTLEQFEADGHLAKDYPPLGYLEVQSPRLVQYKRQLATQDAMKKNLAPSPDKLPSQWVSDTKFPQHAHAAAESGLAPHPDAGSPFPCVLYGAPLSPEEKAAGVAPRVVTVANAEDAKAYPSPDWRASPELWDDKATEKRKADVAKAEALKAELAKAQGAVAQDDELSADDAEIAKEQAALDTAKAKRVAAAKVVTMLLLCLGLGTVVRAQTVPTQTTLTAAVNIPSPGQPLTTIGVASATGISGPITTAPGTELYIDDEAMVVQSVNGTTLTVMRGYDSSNAGQHASGATVYAGPVSGTFGSPFVIVDPPAGACTLANETYTMRINPRLGHIWTCSGGGWALQSKVAFNASPAATYTLVAAQSGTAWAFDRAAGVIYTLPPPAVGLNYRFVNTVAQTSAANEVQTAATTSVVYFMQGAIAVSGTTTAIFAGVPTTSVAVKTNDSTTGGQIGGDFTCTGVSATIWQCSGSLVGSGTVATPFVTAN